MKRITLLITTLLLVAGTASAQKENFANRITIKGYGQVYAEGGYYDNDQKLGTVGINKIEVLGLGRITDQWSMGITVQFNKPVMLKDLYMQYAFMPELKVKVGQFKTPFGHENQIAPFLNPLAIGGSMPTVYFAGVGMDPLYYGTAGRDMGIELSGDLFKNIVSYKVVSMNGQGMNATDLNLGKLLGGSLYIRPIEGLSLHTSYLGGKQVAMGAAKGIQAGESYMRHRVSAGVIANYQPISLYTEYMYGRDKDVKSMGAYLTAAVHLPKRYDLVVSGDYLQPDMDKAGKLYTATLGVDKWFYGNCRVQLQYRYTHPTDQVMLPVAKGHTLRTQFQFAF